MHSSVGSEIYAVRVVIALRGIVLAVILFRAVVAVRIAHITALFAFLTL